MSGLFQRVLFQLGIQQVKSTAYHPQTQGALERFYQIVKNMMKAYCTTERKDWDERIPLLLFAARESIQESLGFSLVFGHLPRGPLKLFKECWLDDDPEKSVLLHVSDERERLRKANEFAQNNLKSAQHRMKVWYDTKARYREFNPGDKSTSAFAHSW